MSALTDDDFGTVTLPADAAERRRNLEKAERMLAKAERETRAAIRTHVTSK